MAKNKILQAIDVAREAHRGQERKYSGKPYFTHVFRVGCRVMGMSAATEDMIVAAFLHDVVEDTEWTNGMVDAVFGPEVAVIVGQLTNASLGSKKKRSERKSLDRSMIRIAR